MGHFLGNPAKKWPYKWATEKLTWLNEKSPCFSFFGGTSSFIAGFAIVMLVFGKVTIPWIFLEDGHPLRIRGACFRW